MGLFSGRQEGEESVSGSSVAVRAPPLSDVRLFALDTEDFPTFNSAVKPEQFSQYFLGVGWDNVQTLLGLRGALPSLHKLDLIIHHFRQLQPSLPAVPLTHLLMRPK
jgi:hypothetical protein